MKLSNRVRQAGLSILILVAGILFVPAAPARTISFTLELTRLQYSGIDPNYVGQTYYSVNPIVASDVAPITTDEISSFDRAFVGTETGWGQYYYGDVPSTIYEITNGTWTLLVNKGDASQQTYSFHISGGSTITSNYFPTIQINSPLDGSVDVSSNATFTWSGPASWTELDLVDHNLDYSFYDSSSPSPATTEWQPDQTLPLGTNEFEITYKTNASIWFTISIPLNGSSQPFTNWVSGSKLDDFSQSGFVVDTNVPLSTPIGHELIAEYTFDNTNNEGEDSSSNNNYMDGYSYWGSNIQTFSTNAIQGPEAMQFYGVSSLTPDGQSFSAWTNTLAGSFTISVWINTTNEVGNDTNNLDDNTGQSVVYGDNNGRGATVGLTGGKVAFLTTDPDGNADTLHSHATVTTGHYVHIVATRDQITGEKVIYINGVRDNSDFATTESLVGSGYDSIGGELFSAYVGLVDDVQIYSGVLSSSEVTALYQQPGATAPDNSSTITITLAAAVNAPEFTWTTSGDAPWFAETATNHDGVVAVQSGTLTDNSQSSILQATVVGPGTFTFWWQTAATDEDFSCEFDVDGNYYDEIGGDSGWTEDNFTIGAGTHTFTWTAYSADTTNDMAWLDQFDFTPAPPVAVLSPQVTGTNFSFSFQTTAGLTHAVEYSTNLLSGAWQTYTEINGDGSVQAVSVPLAAFNNSRQGFVRVTTQ